MSVRSELASGEHEAVQQRDYLCGPFHGARVLRDFGVEADQDLVAARAGTTYAADAEVPPGASSWRDYGPELACVDRRASGTSARGLASAIEQLSDGRLVAVPLRGKWSAALVEGVMALDARLIANLRTGLLWASRPPLAALLGALDGAEPDEPPAAEWDVGHFVELEQLVRGRRGSLVVVRDSYPSLGYGGVHLQPPAALARALNRDDGREGGVLAVAQPERRDAVRVVATELGLASEFWDN